MDTLLGVVRGAQPSWRITTLELVRVTSTPRYSPDNTALISRHLPDHLREPPTCPRWCRGGGATLYSHVSTLCMHIIMYRRQSFYTQHTFYTWR